MPFNKFGWRSTRTNMACQMAGFGMPYRNQISTRSDMATSHTWQASLGGRLFLTMLFTVFHSPDWIWGRTIILSPADLAPSSAPICFYVVLIEESQRHGFEQQTDIRFRNSQIIGFSFDSKRHGFEQERIRFEQLK